jgi:RHS repeat-associated protein
VATFTYSSFGTLVARTGQVSLIYGFTGQETDAESDLMYYDARYYDPTLGRFVSEDPIGFAALDTNLYRYTGNNPINYVDPTGLEGLVMEYWANLCVGPEQRLVFWKLFSRNSVAA